MSPTASTSKPGAPKLDVLPQLHHGQGTRSVRVLWVLEEMGVAHTLHPVLFPPRVRQPEFLQVNPLGSLPAFAHGEARMTESMAICEYVAGVYGPTSLAVDPDEPGFADYRQFCWYGEAALTQPLGSIFRYGRLEQPERRSPQVVEDARQTFARRLEPVSRALEEGEYLAAGRFTLADVSVGYALGFAAFLGQADSFSAEIEAYRGRLAARPAYRRAYAMDATDDAPVA